MRFCIALLRATQFSTASLSIGIITEHISPRICHAVPTINFFSDHEDFSMCRYFPRLPRARKSLNTEVGEKLRLLRVGALETGRPQIKLVWATALCGYKLN